MDSLRLFQLMLFNTVVIIVLPITSASVDWFSYVLVVLVGHYCLEGSANPEKCPPGESQLNIGQDSCIPCRKGYYCPIGATVPDPVICPPYSYCPEGSYEPTRCPNGTYTTNTTEGLEKVTQCKPCVAGSYCRYVHLS